MLTREDIDYLLRPDIRQTILGNLGRDPLKIAMDKRLDTPAIIATQVKYLQRAESKLPGYYKAGCVIHPLAYEQASAEAVAQARNLEGSLCLDLTCGLGVDTYSLSKRFNWVVTLERDPVLAYLAERNFALLGATNITVINISAEEFLRSQPDRKYDLIFADPDRRDADGKKMVVLEDCSPDIISLMPRLREISMKTAVKLSPLFDVDEAFRIFGDEAMVEVTSLYGECKEVMAVIGNNSYPGNLTAHAIRRDKGYMIHSRDINSNDKEETDTPETAKSEKKDLISPFNPLQFKYLIDPDVALSKSRLARGYFESQGYFIENDNSFAFAESKPAQTYGTIFEIVSMEKFSKNSLKKKLKAEGIKKARIRRRNFHLRGSEILSELGLCEGGNTILGFTSVENTPYVMCLKGMDE